MALFISGLAFAGTPFEREAQLATLIGSLLADCLFANGEGAAGNRLELTGADGRTVPR